MASLWPPLRIGKVELLSSQDYDLIYFEKVAFILMAMELAKKKTGAMPANVVLP